MRISEEPYLHFDFLEFDQEEKDVYKRQGTYIMTVNADDAVTDFPPFKHFLFLYKHLSDDGKTLMIILGISE